MGEISFSKDSEKIISEALLANITEVEKLAEVIRTSILDLQESFDFNIHGALASRFDNEEEGLKALAADVIAANMDKLQLFADTFEEVDIKMANQIDQVFLSTSDTVFSADSQARYNGATGTGTNGFTQTEGKTYQRKEA
ncbi:hypothetical protein KQX72_06330 [Listeria monocytogenes]|uniref:hypothetical protein n=1 Tax=Listeria monocytogenes TaxID=1639 RepID=UPI0008748BFA|nr:hypothetical protein [Listeria monocytogenes]EAF4456675.1 hypothetical protein [Listeria monocytogenes serotype 1/2a]EAC7318595.1 hypothetical protein [Listeria monocytogenes]EAD0021986.1 hypothetical protein [Listeria monocytogenes]EAD9895542.1 hypothetical protein [Listeria monocytogenes]EAE9231484.1 hypothetical protein [Listeria monocytogenes]